MVSFNKKMDKWLGRISDSTISDYFSELGYKFKSGVKTGKCLIFQKIANLRE